MSDTISSNKIISAYNELMPLLSHFFEEDVSFCSTDCEKFIKVLNSPNMPIKSEENAPLPDDGPALRAIKEEKFLVVDVPKETFGVPFKSYNIPVRGEDGKIVGAICCGKSLAKKMEVLEISKSLSESLNQISQVISELASGVQEVVGMNTSILLEVNKANEYTKKTDEVLSFVQGVSSRTNLLGLNASIEAARAGEMGRGFGVVAQEIRKLADSTSESIKRIDKILNNVTDSINKITVKINESSNTFESQAAALQQITASIQELNSTAQVLEEMAERII
jgi:uncharacterized protein YoxC